MDSDKKYSIGNISQVTYNDNQSNDGQNEQSKDQQIVVLKKKLKILKSGYIKEREEKLAQENQNKDMKKKMELLQIEHDDKEKQTLQLHKQIEDLQEKLIAERLNKENPNQQQTMYYEQKVNKEKDQGIFTVSNTMNLLTLGLYKLGTQAIDGNKPDLEASNKKLEEDYKFLKQQYNQLYDKLLKADDSVEKVKKDYENQIDFLNSQLKRINKDMDEKDEELKKQKEQFQQSKLQINEFQQEREEFLKKLSELQQKLEENQSQKIQNAQQVEEKEKIIIQLNDLLKKSQQELIQFAQTVKGLKDQINVLENQICLFQLRNENRQPIQMILRQNVNLQYVIEIESLQERIIISAYDIVDLVPNKESNDRFILSFINNNQKESLTYEVDDSLYVCKKIKRFLQAAEEFKKNNPTKILSSLTRKDEQKGYFSSVKSFFG